MAMYVLLETFKTSCSLYMDVDTMSDSKIYLTLKPKIPHQLKHIPFEKYQDDYANRQHQKD